MEFNAGRVLFLSKMSFLSPDEFGTKSKG